MNHIELFAGCGGLSLGLESVGFELVLANELSPMAAESFAYNFFDENLEAQGKNNQMPSNTLWLNSKFDTLIPRLRENPFLFPKYGEVGHSDITNDWTKLKGKLVVGSITELNKLLTANPELVTQLKTAFGSDGGLDLVSGGPPCQSFSMAGLRQLNSDKNSLPWQFARFVELTQPKLVMLENVTGILRPFKDANGNAFHAWYEVAKAFASIDYIPVCLHINAKFSGIAQNRPRFIMIAFRLDHYQNITKQLNFSDECSLQLLDPSFVFYKLVKEKGTDLPFGHLDYFDPTNAAHKALFEKSFLLDLINDKPVSVREALDDLKQNNPKPASAFISQLNKIFVLPVRNNLHNHEFRNHSPIVRRRFRLYQILSEINIRSITQDIFKLLKGEKYTVLNETWLACKNYTFLQTDDKLATFKSKQDFELYLRLHPTKKQTQKALIAHQPAPAALSIPDDACHYDLHELRALTVREMARIQSFPDNFIFRSKVTTGGQMRKYETPQYTQVGNAVPPLLARKLGLCLKKLLP